ncbi:MAG: hypothetical protein K5799_04030 [Erythrobacter sp.]|nr:hypothetical protein [Erythrobacter sp.]
MSTQDRVATSDAKNETPFEQARDRTVYWTLSFYLPSSVTGKPIDDAPSSAATCALREAIDPLFNDIADRSRLDVVRDRLFSAAPARSLRLRLPDTIVWCTEGCAFSVDVSETDRLRTLSLRRFWYQHADGAVSWHLSFDYFYGEDLEREQAGAPPITYYFLALLQKLGWPNEFRLPAEKPSTDSLVGIDVIEDKGETGFWAFVENCFMQDAAILQDACETRPEPDPTLLCRRSSAEVSGLDCYDSRSLFLVHDKAFFDLIQPVDDGRVATRRSRVRDAAFECYTRLIAAQKARQDSAFVRLGDDYWRAARSPEDPHAETRLAYLFLAGFNQNIIDFMNQEASEVLDSLDPIYPKSDEQMEEGFFVRYANPRAFITYVPRSRSLEIGNDWIGTCPYTFLIHTLALHNEALTREQERATFVAIDDTRALIDRKDFEAAEVRINAVRREAFEKYERHRAHNPFRYDTERDVFSALEQLRGTSRLRQAYEGGLAALEEEARDLERRRDRTESSKEADRDRRLAILFGILGVSGVIQVVFQVDQFARMERLSESDVVLGAAYVLVPLLMGLLIGVLYLRKR